LNTFLYLHKGIYLLIKNTKVVFFLRVKSSDSDEQKAEKRSGNGWGDRAVGWSPMNGPWPERC